MSIGNLHRFLNGTEASTLIALSQLLPEHRVFYVALEPLAVYYSFHHMVCGIALSTG